MSENRWLIGIVIILLVALVGLVCVGLGALIYCPQPESFCSGLFGETTVAANTPAPGATVAPGVPTAAAGGPTKAPSTPTRAPARGKSNTLRLPGGQGGGGDPPTLDPANTGDVRSATYVVEIFSGLVALNKDLRIVPEVAEKWDLSSDGKVYTFSLRKNVKFHDGRPVTAQDVKYSIERAGDPKTRSSVAPLYLGDIVGFNDKYEGRAKEISGLKVVDNYTIEITIDAPKSYFLAELTYPTAYIVDKFNIEGGTRPWYLKPNGTGPYKLKEWAQGQRIVLARNEDYYGDIKPSVDEVNFVLGGGSFMTLYENGELDAAAVSIVDIERVSDPANPLNKELAISPELSTFFLVFNTRRAPFDDPNVRKAFAMAIDRQKLVDVIFKKMAIPATGILPQAFPGFNPDLKGVSFDPAQAKQLLAQSKYAGKVGDITWNTIGGGGTAGSDVQAIAEMLKQNLGVNISIEQTDYATYLSQINDPNVKFPMFDIGWNADYVDPHDFLSVLFHSNSLNNWAGYKNPAVDKLLDQASVETDQNKRIEIYRQAEQMIMSDLPVLPLFFSRNYWLTKPYVKGAFYPPLVIPRLKYISLEK